VIVDTSALLTVLLGEPEAPRFAEAIYVADRCLMSVANYVELFLVVEGQFGSGAARQCELFLRRSRIAIEPVTLEQGELARQAFLDYGKGRHKAGLNFGDCFAYALAKLRREPLLFKGGDFGKTDINRAL
jgi:ribonuclease VapC